MECKLQYISDAQSTHYGTRFNGFCLSDLVEGKPTGSIRVSYGYMSIKADADRLIGLVRHDAPPSSRG
jgi:hypothetical protein